MKRILSVFCLVLLLSACVREQIDPAFLASSDIGLTVGKTQVFRYDPLTCQLGFNSARGEFRVSTDTMSDYYVVTLPSIPSKPGEVLKGDILWTSDTAIKRFHAIEFKVLKIESDVAWLWNQQNRIAVTVQILH